MRIRFLLALGMLAGTGVSAQVSLPAMLTSHMVVQRDLPVHVWGMAAPGERVSVSFRGEARTTAAGQLGRWSLYLKPGEAGGPFVLTVTGSGASEQPITLEDVLVGDVWVASGQSNMEFPLRRAATAGTDLPQATNAQIRLLMVDKKTSEYPLDDVQTKGWAVSSPETAQEFSAVAWYFAREIVAREHVAIGVIDSTWGGTIADAWTRSGALSADAALAPVFAEWAKLTELESDAVLLDREKERLSAEAKAQGKPAPQFGWHPNLLSWGPGQLWNGMIAPLTPFPIRGVIWYQGESNSKLARGALYGRVFRTLIEDWRRQWGVGDFPFLFVQISNFKSNAEEDWATVREQQRRTLELTSTAMAVTIDIGNPDDVHPTDKVDAGLRLALAARALSYGESISYAGPVFRQVTPEEGAIRVWFSHPSKGLAARGGVLTGFEVAGLDGKFVPATATIDGETVVAASPQVAAPVYVRYGWANSPQCNLFDGTGLPASPFTSVE